MNVATKFGLDHREFILRALVILIILGLMLWSSMHELLILFGALGSEHLTTMSIDDLTVNGIPIWNSFICSQNLTGITVETLKRGRSAGGSGTKATDETTKLPDSYISKTDTNALTAGDWTSSTGIWPCYIFNNLNEKYKFVRGTVDQLIITASFDRDQSQSDTGLIFGVYDDIKPLNAVEPFTAGIPSINTFTFMLVEKADVNNKVEMYSVAVKQNTYITSTLKNSKFLYSPDNYLVKYRLSLYCHDLFPPYPLYQLLSLFLFFFFTRLINSHFITL